MSYVITKWSKAVKSKNGEKIRYYYSLSYGEDKIVTEYCSTRSGRSKAIEKLLRNPQYKKHTIIQLKRK